MQKNNRTARISEELRREISNIIMNELKDPGISRLTSITKCDVTRDLRYCRAYVSVLGTEEELKKTMDALQRAAGKIRSEAGRRLGAHYSPEIRFIADDSISEGIRMGNIIKSVTRGSADE